MEMTDREWQLLIDRLDRIEGKIDLLNGIRLWKAKVNGALTILGMLVVPLAIYIIKGWIG